MNEKFIAAKKLIDKTERILLVSHVNPDGDALGSMLALKLCFDNLGKQADVFCAAKIPENLKFLPGAKGIKNAVDAEYDLIFGVDYGARDHLEAVSTKADLSLPKITFDHHPFDGQVGDLMIIDDKFSSTCEIVFRFLEANELKVNKEIAVCLLTGILADTWSFRHPNTTAQTLQAVSQLLKTGVSLNKIGKHLNQSNVSGKSLVWGQALAKIKLDQSGFIYCSLGLDDLRECQTTKDDLLSGLSSTLCMVPEAKFALVLVEAEPGLLKGSLRALPGQGIDVSKLAKSFGGGGHALSSGFRVKGRQAEEILETIRELINLHTKQK